MRIATWLSIVLAAGAAATLAQEGEPPGGSAGAQTASGVDPRCGDVLRRMPGIVSSARFESATLEEKRALLGVWVDCAVDIRDPQAAYEALSRFAPLSPNPEPAYQFLLQLALQAGEIEEAVEAFHTLAAMNVDLDTLRFRDVLRLAGAAEDLPNGSEEALRIHETLVRLGYAPDPLESPAGLRLAHVRLLLQLGREDAAARRLERIDDLPFPTLVALAANKTFDPVLAKWQPIDWRAAAENAVAHAHGLAAAHPRRVQAQARYLIALRQGGRDADVVREADRVLAEVAAAPDAFDDATDYLIWIHNERAYALHALGKTREGQAAMKAAIDLGENGRRNTSQSINLAGLYAYEGKWKEALETLASMGQASVYGEMLAASYRTCVAADSGNKAMLAAELSYLRANGEANNGALLRGLICANELDEAAALYIRRLENPGTRGDAVVGLQRWPNRGERTSRARREYLRRLEAVQSRPDVQAAFTAVGRTLDIPFPSAFFDRVY